ncbi:peptide synthase [Rhodococcoides trifolii]|uniref:Peptide synthase n=1 Tax=Rhodococcoides trifolii TaxID=908250 RepID=A0A917D7E0_9NOCA|nr:TauD/TfdA family dioxygenase [Rhodococcus trifolii]GGG13618.1 peptide synthase [Rhodococcus trifolii]
MTVLAADRVGVTEWITKHRNDVRDALAERGSIVIRGLAAPGADQVTEALSVLGAAPTTDREPFAHRRRYADGVYSSTTWPAGQAMCMHHESSYSLDVPTLLLFSCRTPPESGGALGLADSARVLRALPRRLVERFGQQGWILRRAFTGEIGASVAEAFGTSDRADVDRYCRANAIDARWTGAVLHTSQHRSAVVRHPADGMLCWFNQVAFLSEWTMDADVREFVADAHGLDSLPFSTRYGNGDPIEEDVIDTIAGVYDEHTERVPLSAGDLVVVDNVRTAHSREAYTGDRDVVVGMGAPLRHSGIGDRS